MSQFKEGYIYRVVSGSSFSKGSIVVLTGDFNDEQPQFDLVEGSCEYDNGRNGAPGAYTMRYNVVQIWPSIKKETIELNGKKYLKEDLEEALKHLKPVG